jgi:hypothetical protein
MSININRHWSSTKILIMYHYLICCKLKFNLHIIIIGCSEHAHYYNFIFQIFFQFFSIKFYYLYAQKIFASYITIHFIQRSFTHNLIY